MALPGIHVTLNYDQISNKLLYQTPSQTLSPIMGLDALSKCTNGLLVHFTILTTIPNK